MVLDRYIRLRSRRGSLRVDLSSGRRAMPRLLTGGVGRAPRRGPLLVHRSLPAGNSDCMPRRLLAA